MKFLIKYVFRNENKLMIEEAEIGLKKEKISLDDYINLHLEIAERKKVPSIMILSLSEVAWWIK